MKILRKRKNTYENLKTLLTRRFGRHEDELAVMASVAARKKKASETYTEYATALRAIGSGTKIRDEWYLQAFISGLGDMAQSVFLGRKLQGGLTFWGAVDLATQVCKPFEQEAVSDRRGQREEEDRARQGEDRGMKRPKFKHESGSSAKVSKESAACGPQGGSQAVWNALPGYAWDGTQYVPVVTLGPISTTETVRKTKELAPRSTKRAL